MSALATYRKHFAEGRRYGLPAYALGATQRRHCAEAGALAVPRGLPLPRFEQGRGRIELGDVGLYPGVRLHTEPGARIAVGDGSYLNRNTLVWAAQAVVIGREAMIAWDVIISDTEGFGECLDPASARRLAPHTARNEPTAKEAARTHHEQALRARPVRIGDHAWIGAKAMILAGADIGAGAVIAAGAVVRERVEPGAIVAAEPARPLLDLRSRA